MTYRGTIPEARVCTRRIRSACSWKSDFLLGRPISKQPLGSLVPSRVPWPPASNTTATLPSLISLSPRAKCAFVGLETTACGSGWTLGEADGAVTVCLWIRSTRSKSTDERWATKVCLSDSDKEATAPKRWPWPCCVHLSINACIGNPNGQTRASHEIDRRCDFDG